MEKIFKKASPLLPHKEEMKVFQEKAKS